jgi:hypothetical protein
MAHLGVFERLQESANNIGVLLTCNVWTAKEYKFASNNNLLLLHPCLYGQLPMHLQVQINHPAVAIKAAATVL